MYDSLLGLIPTASCSDPVWGQYVQYLLHTPQSENLSHSPFLLQSMWDILAAIIAVVEAAFFLLHWFRENFLACIVHEEEATKRRKAYAQYGALHHQQLED